MTKTRSKGSGSIFRRTDKGPWLASWVDHDGRRRERSTRTTDKATARRILDKLLADAALRRDGVIDASKDRVLVEGRRQGGEVTARDLARGPRQYQDAERASRVLENLVPMMRRCGFTITMIQGRASHNEAEVPMDPGPAIWLMAIEEAPEESCQTATHGVDFGYGKTDGGDSGGGQGE